MGKNIKFIILSATVLCFLGCSVFGFKKNESIVINYPPELQDVHSLILQKKTDDARLKVEDYLNNSGNIHWHGHAYFLKAYIYEIDENYDQAIKFYRSAIQQASAYDSKVEAKALYNLSFVFERVGKMDKLLVSLLDLMKRRNFFDKLTGQVEIPARLAAAYSAQGKMKEALIFHREAVQSYQPFIRQNNSSYSKENLSKALFYLGLASFDQNDESFEDLVKKLNVGQKYFLASVEASKSEWSEKSVKRLNDLYNQAWAMIKDYEPEGYKNDALAHKKNKHLGQLEMASDLYDLMYALRAEEFPLYSVNRQSKEIIDKTTQWILRIEKFAIGLDVGPETVRKKPVKNRKLVRYVEEEFDKVKINKENQKSVEPLQLPKKGEAVQKPEKKSSLGSDPNL